MTSGPTFFCSLNPFHAKYVREHEIKTILIFEHVFKAGDHAENAHIRYLEDERDHCLKKFARGRTSRVLHLSISKPGHTTGRSGRGARRGARAGSGSIGCQQNCLPRKQESLVLSKASKTRRLNVSPESRTSEILCKSNAGTKSPVDNRFIRGLFSTYQRDRERSSLLAANQ